MDNKGGNMRSDENICINCAYCINVTLAFKDEHGNGIGKKRNQYFCNSDKYGGNCEQLSEYRFPVKKWDEIYDCESFKWGRPKKMFVYVGIPKHTHPKSKK